MDEMAIKLYTNEYSDIEVTETSDCEICQYQIVSEKEKKVEINKNNFIIFIDKNAEKIKLKFNNKDKLKIAYGIVRLATNDIKYIPMAYKFENETIEGIFDNNIELNNNYFGKNYKYKPFLAFIFSFKSNITINKILIEYDIIKKNNNLNKIVNIILIISICLSLIIAIIIFIFICIKRKKEFNMNNINSNNELLIDEMNE